MDVTSIKITMIIKIMIPLLKDLLPARQYYKHLIPNNFFNHLSRPTG